MIYFDTTKAAKASHRSGLTRVSARLLAELGAAATPVGWNGEWRRRAPDADVQFRPDDWLLTPEIFSPEERAGWREFVQAKPCRIAAVYHDSIPLKHPHITWPQSVARHPAYLKMLAGFDRILAVSRASRQELLEFWHWQGIELPPPVSVLPLGADFNAAPRATTPPSSAASPANRPVLLCLGILEPRKNQAFLLDVCADLWTGGLAFELHVVGRVNPHFGRPIVARLEELRRKFPQFLHWHEAGSDATVAQLYARARATAFPTIAEGCGLPLLESLWMGVPCVCSDLPVLRENADGGGCVSVACNDRDAWKAALHQLLGNDELHAQRAHEATTRPLPTWAQAARVVTGDLRAPVT